MQKGSRKGTTTTARETWRARCDSLLGWIFGLAPPDSSYKRSLILMASAYSSVNKVVLCKGCVRVPTNLGYTLNLCLICDQLL